MDRPSRKPRAETLRRSCAVLTCQLIPALAILSSRLRWAPCMHSRGHDTRSIRFVFRGVICATIGFITTIVFAEASGLWAKCVIRSEDYFASGSKALTWEPLESGKVFAANAPPGCESELRRSRLECAGEADWMSKYLAREGVFGRVECLCTYRGCGMVVEELSLQFNAFDVESAAISRVSVGWPVTCMQATRWQTTNPWSMPPRSAWTGGVALAPTFRPGLRQYPVESVLFTSPVWMGLAVDSAAYGVLVWGGIYGRLIFVRVVRRRSGLCTDCGYDRTGIAPAMSCPECGTAPQG